MEILNGRGLSPESILEFADFVFSKTSRPHDFETFLPKVYGPDNIRPDRHLVAMENGKIRAMLMYHPLVLMVGGMTLKVVRVGTICVHPKYRGQGLMQTLMEELFSQEEVKAADLLSLGGQRQRYEYFGFTPGGVVCRYDVIRANVRHGLAKESELELMPFSEKYAAEACRLMATQPIYAQREPDLFEQTLRSWNGEPYVFLRDGVFCGYCVLVGSKVSEVVLKDPQDMKSAVKTLFNRLNKEQLRFELSLWNQANCPLSALSEDGAISWQHAYRVNRFDRVVQAFLSAANAHKPLAHGTFSLAVEDVGRIAIEVDAEGVKVDVLKNDEPGLSQMDAFRALCTLNNGFLPINTPLGWFPLPIFIPSADVC